MEHYIDVLNILHIFVAMGNIAVNKKYLSRRNGILPSFDNMNRTPLQNDHQLREIMGVNVIVMGKRAFLNTESKAGLQSQIPCIEFICHVVIMLKKGLIVKEPAGRMR
ncbi:hypothetical protein D3C81_2004390 [compost metagenome]